MNFNYPDFLNQKDTSFVAPPRNGAPSSQPNNSRNTSVVDDDIRLPPNSNPQLNSKFNDILFNKLSSLEEQPKSPTAKDTNQLPLSSPLVNPFSPQFGPFNGFNNNFNNTFNLPYELQGGIGTISSRRPSYAAESFTRSFEYPAPPANKFNLQQYASMNNYSINQLSDNLQSFNLNSNLNDFQSRRPSQLVDFDSNVATTQANVNTDVILENGLILRNQYITASSDLRKVYIKTIKYFQNVELSEEILAELKALLENPKIIRLITFIKNLNNLTFNHKVLCLVINKNGKFDILSYPTNSNIFLQKNDLVIVDGDRGKDLVMILEPLIDLNFAILFNFLKKIEHLKSLNIIDESSHQANKKFGGTHSSKLNASTIVNNHSNEDNEFIITLPTKHVLRFATPKEINKISGKFLEEKKAFITCYNKIKELNLDKNLQLINVEYQSDFKKLIFYYFANFKRIDFRSLIKELFKIYKTRIWLCAILPYDKPQYLKQEKLKINDELKNSIPHEYNLTNDQIVNFLIEEFSNLDGCNYFHSLNLRNLIHLLKEETEGSFYGF